MTVQSAAGKLFAHWRTIMSGYDSIGAQLLDQSGRGNNLPKLGGTPSFTTFGSSNGMDMPGNVYFGAPADFLPINYTLVVPVFIHGLPTGGASGIDVFRSELRDCPVNDPTWSSPASDFGVGSLSSKGLRIMAKGDFGVAIGGSPLSDLNASYTDNAWSVMQLVVDFDASSVQFRIGTGTWQTWSPTNGSSPLVHDEFRLGYRSAGSMGASKCATSQYILYEENAPLLHPTEYAALITALMSDPDA